MITFKTIIVTTNRRKDGTYPVKIRVTYKGKSRRLPTTMVCKATDLTRSMKIKNADILHRGEQLIAQMREVSREFSPFDLEDHDVDWVVARIRRKLGKDKFRLDYFAFADSFLKSKSPTTGEVYRTALRSFARFLGEREVDINDITHSLVSSYVDSLAGLKTAKAYVMMLSAIHSAAKDKYNDDDEDCVRIPRSPFARLHFPTIPAEGQSSIGVETMQRIISDRSEGPMRVALDAFVISFGLMGANLADLYDARPCEGVWTYERKKTRGRRADRARMVVNIPPQIAPYIERMQDGRCEWWLPRLRAFGYSKDGVTQKINYHLRRWAERNGVAPFTFYAARHTFATLGRKIGVEKATIDECLAHVGDFAITDIYAERSWEIINEANAKVLALFDFTL